MQYLTFRGSSCKFQIPPSELKNQLQIVFRKTLAGRERDFITLLSSTVPLKIGNPDKVIIKKLHEQGKMLFRVKVVYKNKLSQKFTIDCGFPVEPIIELKTKIFPACSKLIKPFTGIQTLHFIKKTEVKIIEQIKEPEPPPKTPILIMSEDISKKTENKELAHLFTTLIKRFPENSVESWLCDSAGSFSLKFKQPAHIWMPSSESEGGIVILFGEGTKGMVSGKLEKNKISFTKGADNYVCTKFMGFIKATFLGIQYKGQDNIQIGGKALGINRWVKRTYAQVEKDWSTSGEVIISDYALFLKNKAGK